MSAHSVFITSSLRHDNLGLGDLHVVLDGNRRLAALKVRTVDKFSRDNHWEIPLVDARLREELRVVPGALR